MTHPSTNGRLFLLSSGSARGARDPILRCMLERLGVAKPRIAYVGAASGDDLSFFRRLRTLFTAAGAGAVEPVTVQDCADPAVYQASDLVFISGGDVEEGMRALEACGADRLMRALHRAGKPFMGLSAGSIMLGRSWIRWRDPDDDRTAESFPCLGLAPFIVDCHDEDSGWGELRALLALSPSGARGYGIPCDGGLVVGPSGRITVVGRPPERLRQRREGA